MTMSVLTFGNACFFRLAEVSLRTLARGLPIRERPDPIENHQGQIIDRIGAIRETVHPLDDLINKVRRFECHRFAQAGFDSFQSERITVAAARIGEPIGEQENPVSSAAIGSPSGRPRGLTRLSSSPWPGRRIAGVCPAEQISTRCPSGSSATQQAVTKGPD